MRTTGPVPPATPAEVCLNGRQTTDKDGRRTLREVDTLVKVFLNKTFVTAMDKKWLLSMTTKNHITTIPKSGGSFLHVCEQRLSKCCAVCGSNENFPQFWPNFKTHPDQDRVSHKVGAKLCNFPTFCFLCGFSFVYVRMSIKC